MEPLPEITLAADPFSLFATWYENASRTLESNDPSAVCLSTIDTAGFPDGRMVLLKGFSSDGFVFYTNVHSKKGESLLRLKKAALTFYWEESERQIRIKGSTELVSDAEADNYFAARPRMSQISAWASKQSTPIASREELEKSVEEIERRFGEDPISRPPHWTGFRLIPISIEFWEQRPNRLHDRILYTRKHDGDWEISRLCP